MNIKPPQKAKRQLDRLQELDKEIINIERLAIKLKDGKDNITFSLGFDKPPQPYTEPDWNPDGMDFRPSFLFGGINPWHNIHKGEVSKKETTNFEITDVIALQVLGVIVAHKENERMTIVNELNKMGVEVNV